MIFGILGTKMLFALIHHSIMVRYLIDFKLDGSYEFKLKMH